MLFIFYLVSMISELDNFSKYQQEADILEESLRMGIQTKTKEVVQDAVKKLTKLFEELPTHINRGIQNYPLPQRIADVLEEGKSFLKPSSQDSENGMTPILE